MRYGFLSIAAVAILSVVAVGQQKSSAHPDFSGIWAYSVDQPPNGLKQTINGKTVVGLPDLSGRRAAREEVKGALPSQATPQYKPEFLAKVKELDANQSRKDGVFYCGRPGVPRLGPPRKVVQSAIYLPHFLSWVVIAGVFVALLSPSDGSVSQIAQSLGFQPVNYLTNTGSIRWILVLSENWRSAGWDSLLYLAAIVAIDPALYDAADIDGANRWQKIRYITLPGITPTIATLFILNMGMFLSADLNQVINFQNDVNSSTIDIIDTYVYRIGLQTGEYSLATAAGVLKAVLGMALVLVSHFVSKRLTGRGLW